MYVLNKHSPLIDSWVALAVTPKATRAVINGMYRTIFYFPMLSVAVHGMLCGSGREAVAAISKE